MNPNEGKFFLFQKKEEPKPKKGRLVLFSIITLVWAAGIVLMFLGPRELGYACWGVSFLTAFVVYLIERHRQTLDEVREAEMLADAKTDPADEAQAEQAGSEETQAQQAQSEETQQQDDNP